MRYAEVAVNVPTYPYRSRQRPAPDDVREELTRTFHYAIPTEWEGRLRIGQLVQVPFGKRQVQGLIVDMADTSPVEAPRYVSDVLDEAPALTPAAIHLARWISRFYLTPLFSAIQLMLPPGLQQQSRLAVRWTWEGALPPDLTKAERRLAEILSEKGELHAGQLNRLMDEASWRKAVKSLAARGMVQAGARLLPPRARTQSDRFVRLPAGDARRALIHSSLGRRTHQSRLLEALLDAPPAGVPLATVCEEVSCPQGTAAALEKKGLARIEDGRLALAVPPAKAERALVDMRGLHRYLAVLELLTRAGEPVWVGAVYAETGADAALLRRMERAGLIVFGEQERVRDPLEGMVVPPDHPPRLTPDQQGIWEEIEGTLREKTPAVFLLHGVTGSGKTEIYLRALESVLGAGRQAIVLVPEISLTPQTIRRFAARFPGRVTTIHSGLSLGERFDQWRQIRDGRVDIVIGPRSAVFAPLPRLGIIIIDEEHEDSYKSERMPAYHARDVALERARLEGCPVIMGSATPSLESYYRAQCGEYRLLELPKRVMGHARAIEEQRRRLHIPPARTAVQEAGPELEEARFIHLPAVEVVDMRHELRAGNRSIFSRSLQRALREVLERHEQAILFLNRRGSATVVSCRDCGYVVRCERCSVPLTYHAGADQLVCHHCNFHTPPPRACPQCGSRRIRYLGTGTERVESALGEVFPGVRTLRWDSDVTTKRGAHEQILDRFIAGEADVLIGTQMIAKGLDLPLVTLVGVVLADTSLYLPDFRAAERTFQLLAQVAGRAGRSILGGKVIVQTYTPEHYSIQFAAAHDFAGFYERELAFRRETGYPPFSRLAVLRYAHRDIRRAQTEGERVRYRLDAYLQEGGVRDVDVIGPVPCFFSRVRESYRWQIILKCADPSEVLAGFPLPSGWRLDIDPTSLL